MKRRTLAMVALLLTALVACEKDRAATGSGALTATEKQLFQVLPKGAQMYFGGNYSKLQDLMNSGVGKFSAMIADKIGPGVSEYMACLARPRDMTGAVAVKIEGKSMRSQVVFHGMKLADVTGCAQKANLKLTSDPDGKFVNVELPTGNASYLVLPSGDLYQRQDMELGTKPNQVSADRAGLEADIAALAATGTAVDDPMLASLAARVDRTKTGWLVGSAAGTPLAEKIDVGYATFDMTSGLGFDVVVKLKNSDDAEKVEQGVSQMRSMADQLPGDFKDVVKNLRFSRSGKDLHFGLTLSDAQLKSLTDQLGSMIGPRLNAN